MTDREKAIIMAHTGICMLAGDKFQIFHKYVEDIMGRPIWTGDIGWLEKEIKEKSKADFMALCADEGSSEKPNDWIPVSERLPEDSGEYLVWIKPYGEKSYVSIEEIDCEGIIKKWNSIFANEIVAWMPLPLPWKGE